MGIFAYIGNVEGEKAEGLAAIVGDEHAEIVRIDIGVMRERDVESPRHRVHDGISPLDNSGVPAVVHRLEYRLGRPGGAAIEASR
jgi:hypothetical protein